VDIDTFRDYLHSEAKLQLTAQREGFLNAVKDESDWQLNIYKAWLWTSLNNGIGSSIVLPRA
jgi:hypothetical protein